jgi:hypothetical protein
LEAAAVLKKGAGEPNLLKKAPIRRLFGRRSAFSGETGVGEGPTALADESLALRSFHQLDRDLAKAARKAKARAVREP